VTGKITKQKSENQKQNKNQKIIKKIRGWGALYRLSRKNA